jgi:5-methyltetrahydropteroyltriglutamate--homocysteine methyltransferase
MQTSIQGFPRMGAGRELKFALEGYWQGTVTEEGLREAGAVVRRANYALYAECGLDYAPVGDFSLYDKMLDTALMLGVIPQRFAAHEELKGLDLYFAMARGTTAWGRQIEPLSLKKWFNTNYHYLVPEVSANQAYRLHAEELLALVDEAAACGVANPVPVLIGPCTFLALSDVPGGVCLRSHARAIARLYASLLGELAARGVRWVQIDEPALVMDPLPLMREAVEAAFAELARSRSLKICLQTYFDEVGDSYEWIARLPVDAIGLDFVAGPDSLARIREHGWSREGGSKKLFAGLVDGRNVWCLDVERCRATLGELRDLVPEDDLVLSTSCSLLHVPYTVEGETGLPPEVRGALAFAKEKCLELQALKSGDEACLADLAARRAAFLSAAGRDCADVRGEAAALTPGHTSRPTPGPERLRLQQRALRLPPLPATTIGSFPQTADVRRLRRRWRRGELTDEQYENRIADLIIDCVRRQDEIGLDVLVHGEFERTDMVEFFGEKLDGFVFTRNGWVQSYGSRCVKPPIVYGDVAWRGPMTVEEFECAQAATRKPVKGMLTGPVTILNWSFVRDDLPRRDACRQIALALRKEVAALEAVGAKVIQVDEPALREGLPLRADSRAAYLRWAVECFKLATSGVRDLTQIHTHMCYSEFAEIMDDIIGMDADVITIENVRGGQKLLEAFRDRDYPNQIGPGVYDIHSPLVPSVEQFARRIERICEVLPAAKVWVNPDCGLKTRADEEVYPALENMVQAARAMRARLAFKPQGSCA